MDDFKEVLEQMPDEVKQAVARFGFDKLAAHVYGVPVLDERAAAEIIGTKLAHRIIERRAMVTGIQALAALEKEAVFIETPMITHMRMLNQRPEPIRGLPTARPPTPAKHEQPEKKPAPAVKAKADAKGKDK